MIDEARAAGSNYPDTTLRTFIVGPMCANSPDHHAVQYADLVRVGRGLYRLNAKEEPSRPSPEQQPTSPSEAPVLAAHDAWFWEGNVQAVIVRQLAADGWQIRRVADTASREHGVDIEAKRNGQRLLAEVKGYPATTYAAGARAGQVKPTPGLQARASFSHAVLTGLLMRNDHPDAAVVLAFPAMETYLTLAGRTRTPLMKAAIGVWVVDENGAVTTPD